jgi:hypothetical protein
MIENQRQALHISEYSLSPSTLEQVFIYFAKQQVADDRGGS